MSVVCIGPYSLTNPLILAPMAGVTDRPFRQLCRRFGADLVVGEMITSDTRLWNSRKSQLRLVHEGDPEPRVVQIAGGDPQMLAEAACANVALGAQIIDINLGCPAKKVCNKAAGSALMKDEALVAQIVRSVVSAVTVPVTLKMRTGWDDQHKNALNIARIAQDNGIAAVSIHGRTRTQLYTGHAEYDTIAEVKQALQIPVFANGDIDSPRKAQQVLEHTQADGLLIGRAAQGKPWIFKQIKHFLEHGTLAPEPTLAEQRAILLEHLSALHAFYGPEHGVRIARKHVAWYLNSLPGAATLRATFNKLSQPAEQQHCLELFFAQLAEHLGRDAA